MCSLSLYTSTSFNPRKNSTSWIFFFFFNDTATTEIYTLSLHDALPISTVAQVAQHIAQVVQRLHIDGIQLQGDRKSTRLNSSHLVISYAVFCLKKKTNSMCPLMKTGGSTSQRANAWPSISRTAWTPPTC